MTGHRGSPQECLDASQKLVEIEGFDEIIVGSGPQSRDAVGHGVARGQHQDRDRGQALGGFRGAQAARNLEPVHTGHHHVEHQEIGRALAEATKRAHAASLPLRRLGTPEDLVGAFVFLACEESRYFCGQTLHPNGGEIMP